MRMTMKKAMEKEKIKRRATMVKRINK